jgi:arylsulfatase A-like enzyme
VIVAADHGEQLYEKGYISHSAQVYEQSTRVPLVVRLPNGPRGMRLPDLVSLLDVAPTVLDLFGLRGTPFEKDAQGASLLPVVAGAAPADLLTVSRTVWDRPVYAVRDARFKLIHDTRTGGEQLFAIEDDAGETRDLAAAEPVRAAYYRQSLQQLLAEARQARRPGASAEAPRTLSAAECENLKSLGYTAAGCP